MLDGRTRAENRSVEDVGLCVCTVSHVGPEGRSCYDAATVPTARSG